MAGSGDLSRAGWKRALDSALGRVQPAAYTPFLALATDAVAPAGNTLPTEYAATGYARQAPGWSAPTDADPPVEANAGILTFGPFTGTVPSSGSAVVKYGFLMDASSGGVAANMYAFWTWGAQKTPATNDSLQIAASALSVAGS